MALWGWTGFEVLTAMEKVPVGDEDRPAEPISINGATVFVNPFKDEEEEERKAAEKVSICGSAHKSVGKPRTIVLQDHFKLFCAGLG